MSLGLNARSYKVDNVAKKITELTLKAVKRAIPRGSRKITDPSGLKNWKTWKMRSTRLERMLKKTQA